MSGDTVSAGGSPSSEPISEHAEILDAVRRMAHSPDAQVRLDALEYVFHHGPVIPPEIASTIAVWFELLQDADDDVRLQAQSYITRAFVDDRLPEEIVDLLTQVY
jgi:HEAT repeat protein